MALERGMQDDQGLMSDKDEIEPNNSQLRTMSDRQLELMPSLAKRSCSSDHLGTKSGSINNTAEELAELMSR